MIFNDGNVINLVKPKFNFIQLKYILNAIIKLKGGF